jgi:ribosomal protein S18 acetylase RimI-like enzyme
VTLITEQWGSPQMVSRGKIHQIDQLPGIVGLREGKIIGLLTYHLADGACEIVSVDSLEENQGIGSRLIQALEEIAIEEKCSRIWLITSNDNIRAIRFYQKRGYDLVAVHRHAIDKARELKPQIPLIGDHGIPIRHELEFEKRLGEL